MKEVFYFDRLQQKICREKIYGKRWIQFLYETSWGKWFAHLFCRFPLFSFLYGFWQKSRWSRRKVLPFIEEFQIDSSEFSQSPSSFSSFNDFFIRTLRRESRPLCSEKDRAIIPADGRYLCFQDIREIDSFFVKQQYFRVQDLLQNAALAEEYSDGSLILGRLAPVDCHRFFFPCAGKAGRAHCINGFLYSVNPIALWKNMVILQENRRMLCTVETEKFGRVLMMEIGATNVGSIHYTYRPGKRYERGEEKGYFSFGGSAVILLFQKEMIQIDVDLLEHTRKKREVLCHFKQSLGMSIKR